MHVLLVYPNKPRLTYGAMPGPYGLETLRAELAAKDIDSRIVNPYLSLEPRVALDDGMKKDTGLIGVSLRNLDDALTLWDPTSAAGEFQTESCLPDFEETVAWLRALAPGIPLVLGGAAFGQMPEILLRHLGADAGFAGASEQGFAALAEALAAGRRFADAIRLCPGAIWLENNNPISVDRRLPASAIAAPVEEREAIYFRFRREAAVRTYSGCPLSCAHCIEHLASRRVRKSPVDRIVREMNGVVGRYPDVERFFFADSEVNLAGEARTLHLVETLRSSSALADIPLVGYFNPRPASFSFVERLSLAKCEMRFTVDHVVDTILRRNGKNFCGADLDGLARYHADLRLPFSFCLLLGQPGESRATVDEVLRFVDRIPEAALGPIYFSPGVRVYPGTPLARRLTDGRLDRNWLVSDGPQDPAFLRPSVYCEGWRPRQLFDYVTRHAGDRIRPMNPYLQGLHTDLKVGMEAEFHRYCIGLAQHDVDGAAAWQAWSRVRGDAPFLSHRQRKELLWVRGRLALQQGKARRAYADWVELRRLICERAPGSSTPHRLTHNIGVARAIMSAEISGDADHRPAPFGMT